MDKIITFISVYGKDKDKNSTPTPFTCPDGRIFSGVLTNVAPVRYLLSEYRQIKEIVCIVTDAAAAPGGSYESFKEAIEKDFTVNFTKVDFHSDDSFNDGPLPKILDLFTPDDGIYLETAGGKRDTGSQLLTYQGTSLREAVYTDFDNKKIISVLDTYRTFDLINGLNEFMRTCNVDTLQAYYKYTKNNEVKKLLSAMSLLSECIVLSRTEILLKRMEAFEEALEGAEKSDDPILRILLPLFKKKYHNMKTIPDVILWCVENNLLQQAVTIYNERIPEYLIDTAGILTVPDSARSKKDFSDYAAEQNPCRHALYDSDVGFASLGNTIYSREYHDCAVRLCENMRLIPQNRGFRVNIPYSDMENILRDFIFVAQTRNQMNHDGDISHKERTDYLNLFYYPSRDSMTVVSLRQKLTKAIERIQKAAASVRH